MEVTSGEATLGVLYNFAYAGASLFYQSGLRLDPDKRVKIGLVAHASAIEHCRAAGLARYEFLAGDDQYKKSLSTASPTHELAGPSEAHRQARDAEPAA